MSNNKQQTAVKQFVATFKTSIQIGPDACENVGAPNHFNLSCF